MDKEQFLQEYGKAWERMFKQCFRIPEVNNYLQKGWWAVYNSIVNDGWDETPEIWKMLAWKATCEHLSELYNERSTV